MKEKGTKLFQRKWKLFHVEIPLGKTKTPDFNKKWNNRIIRILGNNIGGFPILRIGNWEFNLLPIWSFDFCHNEQVLASYNLNFTSKIRNNLEIFFNRNNWGNEMSVDGTAGHRFFDSNLDIHNSDYGIVTAPEWKIGLKSHLESYSWTVRIRYVKLSWFWPWNMLFT